MKQACSLESMVDAVLSEMKRRGNAKNTIERHERAYSQFYEYALTQGENSYSKVLARSFLEEKEKLSAYRGPRFMEQYRIALNKLDDICGTHITVTEQTRNRSFLFRTNSFNLYGAYRYLWNGIVSSPHARMLRTHSGLCGKRYG